MAENDATSYYRSLTEDKRAKFVKCITEYQKRRYANDEVFREKRKAQSKAYNDEYRKRPEVQERQKLTSYLYAINLKHKAGLPVKQTAAFRRYGVVYDDASQSYVVRT
jgi:hypothetical protein